MSSPLRRTAALAAGLAVSTPAQSQRPTTFPTDNPAIKRIWQIGMDSSRVEALGQALLDSIGPRLTGSPGMLAASDWAIAQYKSWGIDATRENYGAVMAAASAERNACHRSQSCWRPSQKSALMPVTWAKRRAVSGVTARLA